MKRSKKIMVKQILDEADKWTISMIVFVALSFMVIGFLRSTEVGTGISVPPSEHHTEFNTLENPESGPVLSVDLPSESIPDAGDDSAVSDQ